MSPGDPIWWRDAGLPSWPEAPRRARERVVVVGAGLAGLGVARALRERGVDALVVDREGPASGASGRNAGFVLRTHVTEYPALRARVGTDVARAMLSLAAENAARVSLKTLSWSSSAATRRPSSSSLKPRYWKSFSMREGWEME